MKEMVITIVTSVIGAGTIWTGLFTFLQFLIKRKDEKNDKQAELKADVKELKADIKEVKEQGRTTNLYLMKTRIMQLIADYPDNVDDILTLAKEYFETGGNGEIETLFKQWIKKSNIRLPSWYREIIKQYKQ